MAAVQPTEAVLRQLAISPTEPGDERDEKAADTTVVDDGSSTNSSFSRSLNPNALSFSPAACSQSPTPSSRSSSGAVATDQFSITASERSTPFDQFQAAPPRRPQARPSYPPAASLRPRQPDMPPQRHAPAPWMYPHPPHSLALDMAGLHGPPYLAVPYPQPAEAPLSPTGPPQAMFIHSPPPTPPPGVMMGMSPPSPYGYVAYGSGSPPPPPHPGPSHVMYPYPPHPPGPPMPHPSHFVPYGEYPHERQQAPLAFVQTTFCGAPQGPTCHAKDHPVQQAERQAIRGGSDMPSSRRSFDSVYYHSKHAARVQAPAHAPANNHCKHSDTNSVRRSCDGRLSSRDSKASSSVSKDSGRDSMDEYAFDVTEARGAASTTPPRTTLMIRNIPNKYSQKMLLAILDKCYSGRYDFFYLPIDFKNRCNLGYAFINFKTGLDAAAFYEDFHNKRWQDFNSKKVCGITYARVQGRRSLVEHFKNSKFPCDQLDYLPLVFEPLEASTDAAVDAAPQGGQPLRMKAVPITLCDDPASSVGMVTAH